MRMVAEYRKHSEGCRKLAKLAANPEDRKVFEDMAHNWDLLADLRIGDIQPENQSTSVPPRHSGTNRFRSFT
jgi:hypothetical protein